jgi:hypothetical protein
MVFPGNKEIPKAMEGLLVAYMSKLCMGTNCVEVL